MVLHHMYLSYADETFKKMRIFKISNFLYFIELNIYFVSSSE